MSCSPPEVKRLTDKNYRLSKETKLTKQGKMIFVLIRHIYVASPHKPSYTNKDHKHMNDDEMGKLNCHGQTLLPI